MNTVNFISTYLDKYPLEIVGENSYQANLQYIADAGDDETEYRDDTLSAQLILEDGNPYDRGNAVRVNINDQTVGYLSKTNASKYRKKLAELKLLNVVGVCNAVIAGRRDEFDDMRFGVWLDLDLNDLRVQFTSVLKSGKPSFQQPAYKPEKKVTFGGKVLFVPTKGKGCIHRLVVFPIIGIINIYILLFAGIWYVIKWVWDNVVLLAEHRKAG